MSLSGWARCGAILIALLALAGCKAEMSAEPGGGSALAAAAAAPPEPPSPLGSYLAARHAQEDHDYANAARLMEQALADDPHNLDLVRRTFVLRVSEGRVDEAVPLAHQLVASEGNSGLAALVLLIEDIKAGNFEAAAKSVATLPREGAQRFAVPLLSAWIEAGRRQPAAARKALDSMGNLQALEPLYNLHLGLIEAYLGRDDAAMAAFDRLVAGNAQLTWRVAEIVGNYDERHGRAAEARRLYQRLAGEDADAAAAADAIARVDAGKTPDPIVATPAQGAAEALFDLGSLLNQRDTVDAALIYVRLALALEPKFPLALMLAGDIREEQERTADALALYRAVDPNSAMSFAARLRAAIALDTLERTDEAIKELQAMAAERPARPEPLVELGDILRGHERFEEAAQAYDQAIKRSGEIGPIGWRLYYDRGVAYERAGQWPLAEADLEHALKLQPDQPLVLNYLGYSWIDKGQNLTEALKMVQRAVELRPNDGYIVDSLGWAFFRLGQFPQATEFLERAIELLPEDPTINDHLGDAYWRTGRLAEARYQWRRALQFHPEPDEVKSIEVKLDRGLQKSPTAMNGG